MREPNFFVRLSGFWPVTLLLILCYGLVIYGWHEGRFGLIPALLALGFFFNTVRAAWYMHHYRRWAAEWNEAGEMDGARPPRKRGRIKGLVRVAVVLVLIGVPVLIGGRVVRNQYHVDDLRTLWGVVFVGVAAVLAVRFVRSVFGRWKTSRAEKALAAPASWMLRPARSAPSRRSAARQVPDYARRLLRG